jgi:hypothetical protein
VTKLLECFHQIRYTPSAQKVAKQVWVLWSSTVRIVLSERVQITVCPHLMFCWPRTVIYRYIGADRMHCLYWFVMNWQPLHVWSTACLLQEVLHKQQLVYCICMYCTARYEIQWLSKHCLTPTQWWRKIQHGSNTYSGHSSMYENPAVCYPLSSRHIDLLCTIKNSFWFYS